MELTYAKEKNRFSDLSSLVIEVSKIEKTKGVVLVKYEDGTNKILTKAVYLRMKKSGRKIVLLKEGLHWEELL